jgi:hypothetical protein
VVRGRITEEFKRFPDQIKRAGQDHKRFRAGKFERFGKVLAGSAIGGGVGVAAGGQQFVRLSCSFAGDWDEQDPGSQRCQDLADPQPVFVR